MFILTIGLENSICVYIVVYSEKKKDIREFKQLGPSTSRSASEAAYRTAWNIRIRLVFHSA